MNAQSIVNKVPELQLIVSDSQPDILLITESWCNRNISNAFLSLEGYNLNSDLRLDRNDTANGIGGGLLVYVRNGLIVLSCDILSEFNQYCKFVLKTEKEPLYFYLVYRPPNSSKKNIENLCYLLETSERNSFMIGDFNLPDIDWSENSAPGKYSCVLDTCNDKGLVQVVPFQTHTKGNILDLVLTNAPDLIINIEDNGRIGKSDHTMILIEIDTAVRRDFTTQLSPDWSKADVNLLKENFDSIDWNLALESRDTESSWKYFKETLNQIIEKCVPMNKKRSNHRPMWMNRTLLRLIRKKRRCWRRYKSTKSNSDFSTYKDIERETKKAISRAKKAFEKKLANKENGNSKAFNKYLKGRLGSKVCIGPLKDSDNNAVTEDQNMAEILNDYFSSVFTKEDTSVIPNCEQCGSEEVIDSVYVDRRKVRKKIEKLKPGKAPGPDGISVKALHVLKDSADLPLAIIFNKSMDSGVVPQDWKDAHVTPIFKKGSKSSPGNYRPVSLTSIICKLMESLIKDAVMKHLLENNLIKNSQHGFMPKKSCLTNLLEFLEIMTENLDKGIPTDVLYLDFSKAFDRVPHQRLVKKLDSYNIRGSVRNWICNWLCERRQRVVINGCQSTWQTVASGVPQGSVLGPLCFIIFIDDLDLAAEEATLVKKFADDTKVAHTVTNTAEVNTMQSCIDNLVKWSDTWGMSFNLDKCKVMHIGQANPKNVYNMSNSQLHSTDLEKDIGVLVANNLKPGTQCNSAASKGRIVLGQIARSFHFRDRNVFLKLYKTYVRPHLEFSVSAWSPFLMQDIQVLEKVQMKAVNMISGLHGTTYLEKLNELKLLTLENRRKKYDLVETYKIMHGVSDVDYKTWFVRASENASRTTRLTADPYSIAKQNPNTSLRQNFFSNRVIDDWNDLPVSTKGATNLNTFKEKINELLCEKQIEQALM